MGILPLLNTEQGKTFWVLGSGPSLNFISPQFFRDKNVVATNYVGKVFGLQNYYTFSHYHHVAEEMSALNRGNKVVVLQNDTVSQKPWRHQYVNVYTTPAKDYSPPGASFSPENNPPHPEGLLYGSSSLHGSMHLACWLGASSIVLVGADCGTIDDKHRLDGYPEGHTPWALYDKHLRLVKDYLVKKYDVKIYSLNPFVNLNLEGHTFSGV